MPLFHRGIVVPEDDAGVISARIKSVGLMASDPIKRWPPSFRGSESDRAAMIDRPDLTPQLTRADERVEGSHTFACGDYGGAAKYANRAAGTGQSGLVITFEAKLEDAFVDGNDFLYTAFSSPGSDATRAAIASAFGEAILPFLTRAWSASNTQREIALCDLAVQDPVVIEAHYTNQGQIAGRYNTLFRSAFAVRLPIPAGDIIEVGPPTAVSEGLGIPVLSTRDVFDGRLNQGFR